MSDRIAADQRAWLAESLTVAVPMAMAKLAAMDQPVREWTAQQWATNAADLVAHQGDALMWPVKPRPARRYQGARETAGTVGVFSALARGLAAAAWQPGGVTWLDHHWCTDHAACTAAAAAPSDQDRATP